MALAVLRPGSGTLLALHILELKHRPGGRQLLTWLWGAFLDSVVANYVSSCLGCCAVSHRQPSKLLTGYNKAFQKRGPVKHVLLTAITDTTRFWWRLFVTLAGLQTFLMLVEFDGPSSLFRSTSTTCSRTRLNWKAEQVITRKHCLHSYDGNKNN